MATGRRVALAAVSAIALVLVIVAVAELARIRGDAAEQRDLAGFYEQPADALAGAPGTIIRTEALEGTPLASHAWRIMYRTTDLHAEPVVATGIVVVPDGPAPPNGRTVVAWGHPTTGSAPECAPSRGFDPFALIEGLRMLLNRGYAVVATDFVGMGTAGPDSYLVRDTAAHAVLDAVRATHAMEQADAGARTILWGHSQGGQAVLAAAQEAPDYAPELTIVTVVAAAPAADLAALLGSHLDDISGVTIGSYAFPAFVDVYRDSVPGVALDAILTPDAVAVTPRMNGKCLLRDLDELHRIGQPLVGDFFAHDPVTTQPWATLLAENSVGAQRIDVPVLIVQGAADELVRPADTREFVAEARRAGTDIEYHEIPLADHATIAYAALPALDGWLDAHDR